MLVGEDIRNRIAELSGRKAVFRVTAINVISSEASLDAQVLESTSAVFADAVCRVKPRNADAVSFFIAADIRAERVDDTDDLMSRNDRTLVWCKITLDSMQIGVTKSASVNPNANLARRRNRSRDLA